MQDLSGLDGWLSRYKIPLALSIVGTVLMVGGIYSSQLMSHLQPQPKQSFPKESVVTRSSLDIKVDVSGQVTKPGVYSLPAESRVEDAIQAAGGVTSNADRDYLTKSINLAQKLSDGIKVYIPAIGESASPVLGASLSKAPNSVVNINTSDIGSLDSLPGIGQVTAQKIIDNRPYASPEDLLNKKVVSKSVFAKIKDQISVN